MTNPVDIDVNTTLLSHTLDTFLDFKYILRLLMYLNQTAGKHLFIQTGTVEKCKIVANCLTNVEFLPFDVSNQASTK